MEVQDLEINLKIKGWDESGGRSQNVWGQVPTKNLPFNIFKKAVLAGRKAPIWTCLDESIYEQIEETGDVKAESLPKTISATFKPSFSKYSAIAENMAMRIAVALDMPTSYNYLVRFDPKKYPEILSNFKLTNSVKDLQPLGVVSVDFLKAEPLATPAEEEIRVRNSEGRFEWIKTDRNYTGEDLVLFIDNINEMKYNQQISGDNLLAKNWFKSMELLARHCDSGIAEGDINGRLKRIKSRMARSILLREFLSDCDYTDRNSGLVVNREKKYLNYAPNFDYGESFNGMIKTKLDYLPPEEELAVILKFDKGFIEKKKRMSEIPMQELAKRFSSDVGEQNVEFVVKNFPEDTKEFLDSLQRVMKNNTINTIVDSYTDMTMDGVPILSKQDAEVFKDYINCRANWIKGFITQQKEFNEGREAK